MIEVEGRAALDVRPVFRADSHERARAQSVVVEVRAGVAAEQPAIAVAIRAPRVDLVGVDVVVQVFEFVTSDAEVNRRSIRCPVLAGEVDALHREIIGVGEEAVPRVGGCRRTIAPHQIELFAGRHVAGIEGDGLVLPVSGRVVPSVPAIDLTEVVIGTRRDIGVETRARIRRKIGQRSENVDRGNELRVVGQDLRILIAKVGPIGILIEKHLILPLGFLPFAVPAQRPRVLDARRGVIGPHLQVAPVESLMRLAHVSLGQRENIIRILR